MLPRIGISRAEGEIGLGCLSWFARIPSKLELALLFILRRHFSLFILRAATYIATFFRGKPFTASNGSQLSQDTMA